MSYISKGLCSCPSDFRQGNYEDVVVSGAPAPPLFKLKKTSSPHYILIYIRALMLIVYCNMMPSVYLAGVC